MNNTLKATDFPGSDGAVHVATDFVDRTHICPDGGCSWYETAIWLPNSRLNRKVLVGMDREGALTNHGKAVRAVNRAIARRRRALLAALA